MEAGEFLVEISGRIAREQEGEYGISFKIDADKDRLSAQVLVDLASASPRPETAV